jgi:DNA polymerase (family X)
MKNKLVVDIFRNIAEILEIKGENIFRIRAYRKAADTIEGLAEDIENFVSQDRLSEIPGIGDELSAKIKEINATGKLKFYEDLKKDIPDGLLELLKIPSVGPRTAGLLFEKLKIRSITDLEAAITAGALRDIPGIKEKTVANFLKGIQLVKRSKERMHLAEAIRVSRDFLGALTKLKEVKAVFPAGSLRRCKETVRDIDILAISDKPGKVMEVFTGLPQVKEVLAKGETKSSVRTIDDVQVDCRVVEGKSSGAALLYFTGSKEFNVHIRKFAQKKGWKINEYGVFADNGNKPLAGRTEEEIFKLFKMQYVEPELREDGGEFELALKQKLPDIINLKDIKGDLHVHSNYSDGGNSIGEMARAAIKKGYSYIGLTDHSQSLKIAGGLDLKDLDRKKKEIESLNRSLKGFRVLYSTEVDIDAQGGIDYPDSVLKEFDIVVAAIHTGFKQSREQLTKRMVRACQSKFVHIIAHPTGRLWGERDSYELDFEEIFKSARDNNTAMEINSFPERLDLNDHNCRLAKQMGVKLAINTDSHAIEHLDNMFLGVCVARRGWLEAGDVLNSLRLNELFKAIKK